MKCLGDGPDLWGPLFVIVVSCWIALQVVADTRGSSGRFQTDTLLLSVHFSSLARHLLIVK